MNRAKRFCWCLVLWSALISTSAWAQTDWTRLFSGALKAGKAITISDEDLFETVAEEVAMMDKQNTVCTDNSAYAKRLNRLTKKMQKADGIALNFKVYKTTDINAFACPDGSVRVFSALMDILSDEELLGVIGHEIGHVALRHSKNAWKDAILRSAVSDAVGAFSDTWASLSDSYLGDICSIALSAKHSRYHESQADDYGYDFLKGLNINPWAMGKALIKLQQMSEDKSNAKYRQLLQVFSSHPDFDIRIQHIKERAEVDNFIVF